MALTESRGALVLTESAAAVSDSGTVRVACQGGAAVLSADGSDFAEILTADTPIENALHADESDLATEATGPEDAVEFMDTLQAANDVIATLSEDGDTLTVSGLVGDADGDYMFSGVLTLTGNASPNGVNFRPNGLTTNQIGHVIYSANTTCFGFGLTTLSVAFPTNTADSKVYFSGRFASKKGRDRVFECHAYGIQTNGDKMSFNTLGAWTSTVTDLTSIEINADQGMKTGSFVRLRKLRNLT